MPAERSARVGPLSASRRRTCDRVGLDARTSTGVMGIGDDGVDAGDGVARDEIVRETTMVRDPKGDGKRSDTGDRADQRADQHAIDELRRYVCRVLGVDPRVEGESVVPSGGVGSSATRVNWQRVGAISDAWMDEASAPVPEAEWMREGREAAEAMDPIDDDDPKITEEHTRDIAIGRIGPRRALIDRKSMRGDLQLSDHCCSAYSRSNFASFKANTCVFNGRWQYEVTVRTAGIMQVGWATLKCPFTAEHGVGDAQDSYAFDGHRVRKWNVSPTPYGQQWVPGDVITCCIDLTGDEVGGGTVSYLRNGTHMGVAFR